MYNYTIIFFKRLKKREGGFFLQFIPIFTSILFTTSNRLCRYSLKRVDVSFFFSAHARSSIGTHWIGRNAYISIDFLRFERRTIPRVREIDTYYIIYRRDDLTKPRVRLICSRTTTISFADQRAWSMTGHQFIGGKKKSTYYRKPSIDRGPAVNSLCK